MEKIDKNIVIILASGNGSRFGASLPKQYCNLGGRPLLMRTIDRFAEVIPAENILIVIDRAMEGLWKSLCEKERFASPRVTFGGSTRTESLAKALSALAHCPDDTVVMIHDGARPLVSEALIRRMASIPEGYAGAVPAVPVTDTLRHIEADGDSATVARSEYVAVQTPQSFTIGTLRKSFADYSKHSVTDDATMVQNVTGGKIALIDGEHGNIKVTNPIDMAIAEALLNLSQTTEDRPHC